ncbi:MAG: Hpt domain-containing protein [Candidatus Rokuibacteriota bacterium]|jgi:HPt (histidine-containing phosphotransfer) domain-containing protein
MSGSRIDLDVDALLASVDGDCELLDELAAAFTAEVPLWIAELRSALLRGDAQAVFKVAHGVSGAVGYFRAPGVRQRAVDLEAMGREGRLDGAAAAIDGLEADLLDLGRLLEQAPWRR